MWPLVQQQQPYSRKGKCHKGPSRIDLALRSKAFRLLSFMLVLGFLFILGCSNARVLFFPTKSTPNAWLAGVNNFSFSLSEIFPTALYKSKRKITNENMQETIADAAGYRSVVYFANWVCIVPN
jgi:hypothetical protein